ncbi:MAG TPA: hypothetical protein VGS61_05400, partial [Acidimicrobiales bacterium]|nr:hypothetical protein [Acidimicrobiales bacterium]
PAVLSRILNAITQTVQHIYRVAAPIGLVAVVLSFTLPEIQLRTTIHRAGDEVPLSNADPLA